MNSFFNNKIRVVFAFLFLVSVLPFIGKISNKISSRITKKELFRPELVYLNSIDKAIIYTDSIYSNNNFPIFDTAKYVQIVSEFTKERFHHGLSKYNISDNWIAYLSGKLIWSNMSAIVKPDDILKHSEGLCSQQTIVFMEILKRKGVKVRSLGLGYKEGPGHFLSEAHYNGTWHVHDVTMEPMWKKVVNHHESMYFYLKNTDSLYLAYDTKYDRPLFNKLLEKVEYGKVNEFPAKKMLLFHQITLLFTYILPIVFGFLFLRTVLKIRKS